MNHAREGAAFSPCVLVPVYNHEHAIVATCEGLADLNLPIVLIDDGSHADCAAVLDRLAQASDVHLLRIARNQGKGHAVRSGLSHAQSLGFTHALQVDADGQHDRLSLPPFIEAARQQPERLLIGYPRFDHSVPLHRFISRYITHVWVWCNTLSTALRDTMCGVRLYPLNEVNAMLARHDCGDRMEFDTEVLVRWFWAGKPVDNLPVRVTYPTDGVSHFRLFRDNVLMARMHLRLTLGMLIRLPKLLLMRCRPGRDAQHKSSS
ncbi:glycosyl transferase [Kushneria pakistanensis]|uniref:Glycosyl transferase n=1 Tax=Kushneria pakistanensis TaxID=1508770 RepID=A0ABQ3FLZ2_9GAMM|nr:glycosyltransferase family 2 protein [Kushneria pakistanensis]GHC29323.1 glycosyl transferase [Kushneria pakistanensis]